MLAKKFYISAASVVFLMLSVSHVMALSELGPFKVASMRITSAGTYVKLDPAPAACNGGAFYRMHARLPRTADNYDSIFSTLLTAYTVGSQLQYFFYNDLPEGITACSSDSTAVLDLYALELVSK